MNSMAKQMDMFEEGGLMDEGGTVDPVSGNDVPPGSTQEEVRDDIPAQLSEGEFVFPADVVRYFGLEKLMEMRQEAKMGLKRMEAMGQMGNSEEATLPDDIPFSIEDLDMEDEDEYNTPKEFAYGGIVQMPGTNYTTTPNPGPTTGFRPYVAPTIPGSSPPVQTDPQYQGIQLPGTQFIGATEKTNIPTFGQTVGTNPGQYDEFRTYVNSSGQTLRIPFKNGQPLYPIPQGYTLQKEDAVKIESTVPTTTVEENEGGDGEGVGVDTTTVGSISGALSGLKSLFDKDDTPKGRSVGDIFKSAAETNDFYGGSKAFGFSNEELRAATAGQGFAQLGSLGLAGTVSAITKELGVTDFSLKDVGAAGFTGMNDALNSIGLVNRGQLMNNAQATLVGNTMAAAHAAAYKGQDPAAAIKEVLNSKEAIAVQDAAYKSIKDGWQEKSGYKGNLTDGAFAKEMRSTVARANAVLEDLETGSTTAPSGKTVGTKVMSRDMKTGEFTKPTNVYTKEGIALKNAQTAKAQQAQVLADIADAKAARDARNAQARASAQARADAAAKEAATAGPGNSQPGDYESYGATDDEAGDVGIGDGGFSSGEDTTSVSSDNYDSDGWGDFNKGGLVSQMKRSGLASKK